MTNVDPARAVTEIQGIYGSGSNLMSAYSGELSLVSQVLYPTGTQPTYPPATNAFQGSVDPTNQPITLVANAPQSSGPPYATGEVINMGGLDSTVSAADPFVMEYADGFPTNEVAWGRLTLDTLSQQTRLVTLQFDICMRSPYLAQVQSSSAASHILRSMLQVTGGAPLDGAFGDEPTTGPGHYQFRRLRGGIGGTAGPALVAPRLSTGLLRSRRCLGF